MMSSTQNGSAPASKIYDFNLSAARLRKYMKHASIYVGLMSHAQKIESTVCPQAGYKLYPR